MTRYFVSNKYLIKHTSDDNNNITYYRTLYKDKDIIEISKEDYTELKSNGNFRTAETKQIQHSKSTHKLF